MAKHTTIGTAVLEYVKKYRSTSSRKIAVLLMRDYPTVFTDLENTRNAVRYYRGASGEGNRAKVAADVYTPRFSAPESDSDGTALDPYIIPDDAFPIMVAGDAHIPYHDQDALEICVERAIEIGAKTFVMLGDWLDMYQVSRFEKDPRLRNVSGEIKIFNGILDAMQKALPNTKFIYKEGNHDARFDKYIMDKAPELFDMEEVHLRQLLKLEARGVAYVGPMQVIRYKHLYLIHGHEYVFSISNPVNPARGLYLRSKKSTLCAHHHQSSEHTETDISGDTTTCWSVGCLCYKKPLYMPLNKWNHGFAEIYGDDEMYQVRNRRIIDGRIV